MLQKSRTMAEDTLTSRSRLLAAGKSLFARHGYEGTSTAAIVREAGTSESQLVRYFGGKSGLLNAIFNEAWNRLNDTIGHQISAAEHGREAIVRVLGLIMQAFSRDHEIAFLFLFEGRRVRGDEVKLSEGFLNFYQLVSTLIERAQKDGSMRSDVAIPVLAAALMGAAEGMIRDRILAERAGRADSFREDQIREVFMSIVKALA